MRVTIYDVADKAGVSIATVSKVINNTGKIRDSTRQKVWNVMKELNYQPSVMASALTGKSTETLGLLVPDISNPFFSELARTIEDRSHEQGLSVIMCSTDDNEEKEKKYLELLQRKQVDGLIIASSFNDRNLLKQLVKQNIPLVMLTQDDPSLGVTCISVDDFSGGFEATSHLLSLGHENIAILAENTSSSKMRIFGSRDAYETFGLTFNDSRIIRTTASVANGKNCLDHILEYNPATTAIFACNDQLAIGVLQRAKERGIVVPDKLSIVGFDNTILAETTVPSLTTVAQPIKEMGSKVVDLILETIKKQVQPKERILYNPELIIRETTSKCR
ncbi:LacI family DNA-binding transcriptional regulator [Terribacillus sp. 179-K 1B1 HS]|uniref:LacI family DNA-binding transcriptional regulator n=1 Tax=Terribacillus sp. 179-K 1B1 HS TaxID=3142388 RepID=UPI0039A1B1F1